jgi:hypothetical protein
VRFKNKKTDALEKGGGREKGGIVEEENLTRKEA